MSTAKVLLSGAIVSLAVLSLSGCGLVDNINLLRERKQSDPALVVEPGPVSPCPISPDESALLKYNVDQANAVVEAWLLAQPRDTWDPNVTTNWWGPLESNLQYSLEDAGCPPYSHNWEFEGTAKAALNLALEKHQPEVEYTPPPVADEGGDTDTNWFCSWSFGGGFNCGIRVRG